MMAKLCDMPASELLESYLATVRSYGINSDGGKVLRRECERRMEVKDKPPAKPQAVMDKKYKGPPNKRPRPKSRPKGSPLIKSQAVMVITIDKTDTLQVKAFGEGEAKVIIDVFVDGVRDGIMDDPELRERLRLVP